MEAVNPPSRDRRILGIGSVILGLPKPAFKGLKADELRKRLACPDGYDFVIALALAMQRIQKKPMAFGKRKSAG